MKKEAVEKQLLFKVNWSCSWAETDIKQR